SRSDLRCSKTSGFVHQHLAPSVGNDTKNYVGSLSFFSSNLTNVNLQKSQKLINPVTSLSHSIILLHTSHKKPNTLSLDLTVLDLYNNNLTDDLPRGIQERLTCKSQFPTAVMRTPHPNHHPSKLATSPAEDDCDQTRPTMPDLGVSVAGGLRKKGLCVRSWLLLKSSEQAQVVEADKHTIMRQTGLPAWDHRILDLLLSYPYTVLG
ncbi:hypothetical protein DVH24_032348, partial [Malus domestica]